MGNGSGTEALAHSTAPLLWCLEANHRARRFYERHGWTVTERSRAAEFPPYPIELEYRIG